MKFILTFIFCSGVAGKCLQPAEYPERYADLFGYFIKVFNNKKTKDLSNYASSHYLVTSGNFNFNIDNKSIKVKKGDSIWMSSFKAHGFSGNGSLLKISNGENMDSSNFF